MSGSAKRGVSEWLLACCGVWLVGLGLYFVFLRPALLSEDIRFVALPDSERSRVTAF